MPDTSSLVTAVEIGTSKVVALMGEISADRRVLNIIGAGECPSQGVTKGVITDLKLAGACTHSAIENAERNANAKTERVFLALTGAHNGGFSNEGMVIVQSANGVVSQQDIEAVVAQSRQKSPPEGNTVIHYIQGGFRLDSNHVQDPLRMNGHTLASTCWIAHCNIGHLSNSVSTFNAFNLRVRDVILSSLGSASAVTTREERKQGVLVVDIGAGTTDFVLYRNGHVVCTGVIAVGGAHLTNDLALAFRCPQSQADALKLRHGRAQVQCRDKNERVWLMGDKQLGDRQIPLMSVERVCALRVEELFGILKKRLGGLLVPEAINMGVVLTGGTAQLPAIDQAATEALGLPARIGEHDRQLVSGELLGNRYSSVLGLLQYGLCDAASRVQPPPRQGMFSRFLSQLKSA